MKAKVLSDNLKEAVAWIKPGTPKGTVLPVLSNVLVEAKNQGVRLTLTDLELTVSALAGGKISKAGATTIPLKGFERLVKSLPKGEIVRFKTEREEKGNGDRPRRIDERCIVSCGSLSVTFKTIIADEFPLIKTIRGKAFNDGAWLPGACRLVQHAIAKDVSRLALTFAELKNGTLAGVDGFRLATCELDGLKDKRPITLCRSLVNFLARQKTEPTKVVVGFKQGQMVVWFGHNFAQAKMDEARFPDWRQIVPKSHGWDIRVPYQELRNATELLEKLAPGAKMLRLEYKRGKLHLAANEYEAFEASQQIEAVIDGKADGRFALNVRYLLDTLRARKKALGDKAVVCITGTTASSPVVITDFHSGLREMLMPMHISR